MKTEIKKPRKKTGLYSKHLAIVKKAYSKGWSDEKISKYIKDTMGDIITRQAIFGIGKRHGLAKKIITPKVLKL